MARSYAPSNLKRVAARMNVWPFLLSGVGLRISPYASRGGMRQAENVLPDDGSSSAQATCPIRPMTISCIDMTSVSRLSEKPVLEMPTTHASLIFRRGLTEFLRTLFGRDSTPTRTQF